MFWQRAKTAYLYHLDLLDEYREMSQDNFVEPQDPLRPEEERFVGLMTDDLARLFTLWDRYRGQEELVDFLVSWQEIQAITANRMVSSADFDLHQKVTALAKIFAISAILTFEMPREILVPRKGFIIASMPPPKPNKIPTLIVPLSERDFNYYRSFAKRRFN